MRSMLGWFAILVVAAFGVGCHGASPPDRLTRTAFEGRTADLVASLSRGEGNACDALVWAARGGQGPSILAITARGVNPDACRVGVNRWTPLLHAIHKNQRAAVAALLEAGASANPPADADRLTPLMMAAGNGDLGIVNLLLEAGADPRVTKPNGINALTIAVSGGALMDIDRPLLGSCHPEIVRALLSRAPELRLQPSLRTGIARHLAYLNGCDEVLAMARR